MPGMFFQSRNIGLEKRHVQYRVTDNSDIPLFLLKHSGEEHNPDTQDCLVHLKKIVWVCKKMDTEWRYYFCPECSEEYTLRIWRKS